MNNTSESIYENICRARNRLEVLPPEYSLPLEEEPKPGAPRFADGALDGIALYHMGVPDQDTTLLEQAVDMAPTDPEQARRLVSSWAAEGHMISAMNKILPYVIERQQQLPPRKSTAWPWNAR